MLIQLRKVSHTRFPVGYTIELNTTGGILKATRHIDGDDIVGYYDNKAVAISEQAAWYGDECIVRERAAAAATAPVSNVTKLYDHMVAKGLVDDDAIDAYVDAGGHLSHIPSRCGCGDCLTTMAGEVYA